MFSCVLCCWRPRKKLLRLCKGCSKHFLNLDLDKNRKQPSSKSSVGIPTQKTTPSTCVGCAGLCFCSAPSFIEFKRHCMSKSKSLFFSYLYTKTVRCARLLLFRPHFHWVRQFMSISKSVFFCRTCTICHTNYQGTTYESRIFFLTNFQTRQPC